MKIILAIYFTINNIEFKSIYAFFHKPFEVSLKRRGLDSMSEIYFNYHG
jgi:hypothetical protein